MLYKLLFCVAVLLIGTPFVVRAQEVSPLIVETLRKSTAPTTVRTGELFLQVYKISYIYSERWGKEVLILEDEMKPKTYPTPLGDFEVISWFLDKPIVTKGEETDEYTRHLYVTLRIINPKKGAYLIPKFEVLWALKVGEKIETQEPFETEEIDINYVTTVTKDPYLDIRDSTDFGDYSGQANRFWYISRVGAPSVALISMVLLISSLKSAKRRKIKQSTEKLVDENQQEYIVELAPLSFDEAYRNFFREAAKLEALENGNVGLTVMDSIDLISIQKRLAPVLRDVLRTSLGGVNPGDTGLDIGLYIEKNVKSGAYKDGVLYLQQKLADYEKNIQLGVLAYSRDFREELSAIRGVIRLLKRRWRILAFLGKKV
ncbi:MAG: hypothetical protein Q8Q89_04540 [bacterium]|nr:hypothetical protein [bacterium]